MSGPPVPGPPVRRCRRWCPTDRSERRPMARDWLLSGIPRSGTSLSCRLAGDLPDTVALSEPFNDRLAEIPREPGAACARIAELVRRVRERIRSEGLAPSIHVDGRLYDNIVASRRTEASLRNRRAAWGQIAVDKPLTDRFRLVIRDNSVFAALLPRMNDFFPCVAVVRNPLSVLASWQTVDLPVHDGHVPGAEMFDPGLRLALEREPDVLRRQLVVLDWFFTRFRAHLPPGDVIRYEDLVESGGSALFRRLGHPDAEPVRLENRNRSALYDAATVDALLAALLDAGGAWTHFYGRADCERVADRIRRRGEGSGARTAEPAPPGAEAPRTAAPGALRKALSWLRGVRARTGVGVSRPAARGRARTVWFYRECWPRPTGGHLKHSHYFDHVARLPGFEPAITFGEEPSEPSFARERDRYWPSGPDGPAERWDPRPGDVLFLEGASDWPFLARSGLENLANPRINFIQHVRHAFEDNVRYPYLVERAIRICVSREVADAIAATGRTNGPILTIPNGIDIPPFEPAGEGSPAGYGTRPVSVTIAGYKDPELARDLSQRLDFHRIAHRALAEFHDRSRYLALLAESRVAVCLPRAAEGFYLPALEAMAMGCVVVTLDCIGNRGFCLHEENCLVAERSPESLLAMTRRALAMSAPERAGMHRRARETAARHSLDAERARFHAVLADIDRLWRDA